MRKFIIIFVFVSLQSSPLLVFGQDEILVCNDTIYCIPAVTGMPRSKGVLFEREWVTDHRIDTRSTDPTLTDANDEIRLNRRIRFMFRVPVINKQNFKMAVGLKYFNEEYGFENTTNNFPFYQSLEDKDLQSIGSTLYFLKPTTGERFFLLRLKGSLNGDFRRRHLPLGDYFKFSVAPLIGWKKNDNLSYAFGFAYGYDFGRPTFFPVIVFNKTFNSKWGFESLLPSYIRLRYNINEKTILYLASKLNGVSYNIRLDQTAYETDTNVHLQKSEIRFMVNFEREIHDWLWFGIKAGYRKNLEFSIREGNDRKADLLLENSLNDALIYNLSIFLVPPRQFLE